jgi:hypothetical protein
MDFRKRLRDLVLAGGGVALATGASGCCNANPDPCCRAPSSQECALWNGCKDDGGVAEYAWDSDAGIDRLMCLRPGDDLSMPDLARSSDLGHGGDHD